GGVYGTFTGSAMASTLTTGDFQSSPGQRSFVSGVRPISDAATAKIAVGEREQASKDVVAWQPATAMGVDGVCPQRLDARFLRYKHTTDAGDSWTRAVGIEVALAGTGKR